MSTVPLRQAGVIVLEPGSFESSELLSKYYMTPEFDGPACRVETGAAEGRIWLRKRPTGLGVEAWWKANEADLRRRAKQLPR
jgi:hypothetical protein